MNKRVLIIDDEVNIRRVMRLTLETAGYEVNEAANGAQGLTLYGDGSTWEVVLLDQKMPGMDGLETLRRIKERRADAHVLMATAFASIELAVEAMKLGATDFVRKPMTPETLRHAVAAALAKPSVTTIPQKSIEFTSGDDAAARPRPLIQTITMNGFEIVRLTHEGQSSALEPDEHRYIVRSPDGKEQVVIVRIDEEATSYVERMTRRRIPASSTFWEARAGRLLSNFLWSEGKPPPGGRLTLKGIDRDELMWAERWKDDAR